MSTFIVGLMLLLPQIPFPGPGRAPTASAVITVVNTAVNQDTGTSTTLSAPATNHTTGNLLVVGCRGGNSTYTVSDTTGNTYTALTVQSNPASGNWQWLYAKNITGNAANVVTCTTASADYRAIVVYQVSGCSATAPFDAETGSIGTYSTYTSPSFSTTAKGIAFFGLTPAAVGSTYSAYTIGGVAATLLKSAGSGDFAVSTYVIFSSAQTGITATITTSGSQAGAYAVAAFK